MIITRHTPKLITFGSCKSCEEKHREKAEKETTEARKAEEQRKRDRSLATQSIIGAQRGSVTSLTLPITPPPSITPVEASMLIQRSRDQQQLAQRHHHDKQNINQNEVRKPKGRSSEVSAQNPSAIRPLENKALKAQEVQESRTPNRTHPIVDIDQRVTRAALEIATLVSAPPRLVKHEGRSTPLSHTQLIVDTHKARLASSRRNTK